MSVVAFLCVVTSWHSSGEEVVVPSFVLVDVCSLKKVHHLVLLLPHPVTTYSLPSNISPLRWDQLESSQVSNDLAIVLDVVALALGLWERVLEEMDRTITKQTPPPPPQRKLPLKKGGGEGVSTLEVLVLKFSGNR